jgi:hypothetical protein
MTVLITLTIAGSDTGPFDLYSDVDGFVIPFEINVPKASLVSGYTSSLVPNGAILIRVKSQSACTNYIDLIIGTTTTTTTSSTTTTTTTAIPVYAYTVRLSNNSGTICTDPTDTVWSTSVILTTGDTIYYFSDLTGLVTGFDYVVDDAGAPDIYNLDPSNGIIGADTTLNC